MRWIDRIDYFRLIFYYIFIFLTAPFIAALLFFFPLIQIWEAFGWEFPNLGPIATFFWGVMFDIYVATPAFVILLIAKLLRSRSRTKT